MSVSWWYYNNKFASIKEDELISDHRFSYHKFEGETTQNKRKGTREMKSLICLLVILSAAFTLSSQQDLQHKNVERHTGIVADLKKEIEKALLQDEFTDKQESKDKDDNKITEQDMEAIAQEDDGDGELEGLEQAEEQQDDGEKAMATQDDATVQRSYYYWYRYYKRRMKLYRRHYYAYQRYYKQQLRLHRRYKHLYKVYYRSAHYCMHHMTHRHG